MGQRLKESSQQVWNMGSAFVQSTKLATTRFRQSTGTASLSWAREARDASQALVDETRTASDQLIEGLKEESQHWLRLTGGQATLLRLQAPGSFRALTRAGMVRRLDVERSALERLSAGLRQLDTRLQQRLGDLETLEVGQADLLLPPGYQSLSARKITSQSSGWGAPELRAALAHEQESKARSTVLGVLERRLEELQDVQ